MEFRLVQIILHPDMTQLVLGHYTFLQELPYKQIRYLPNLLIRFISLNITEEHACRFRISETFDTSEWNIDRIRVSAVRAAKDFLLDLIFLGFQQLFSHV